MDKSLVLPAASRLSQANATAGAVPDAQNIRRIEARGNVIVVSKDQNASGDLGVYDLPAKTITLTGNVVVSQGKNVIHGDKRHRRYGDRKRARRGPRRHANWRARAHHPAIRTSMARISNFMTIGPGSAQEPR